MSTAAPGRRETCWTREQAAIRVLAVVRQVSRAHRWRPQRHHAFSGDRTEHVMPGPDHGNADRAARTSPSAWGRTRTAQSGPAPVRVGWRFVTLYALSYTGGSL